MAGKSRRRKAQQQLPQQGEVTSPAPRPGLTVEHIQQIVEQRAGPIPPPDDLARYDEIIPSGADRIMAMAEQEAAHRLQLENKVVEARIRDAGAARREKSFGQFFAFITAMTAVISGSIVAAMGQPYAGAAIGGVSVGGLITAFIYGRRSEGQERHIAKE